MPNFVIEREIPGAGQMTDTQAKEAAKESFAAMQALGIQWVHSYVTDDKVYCIYWAPNEEVIREHADQIGVPANRISAVRRLMDATDAE